MEIRPLDDVADTAWDELVRVSPDGWCFCLTGWLRGMAEAWRLEEYSFALFENGRMLGLMPLQFRPWSGIMASGGWGHGGPVVTEGVAEKKRRKVRKALLDHAATVARERGAVKMLCQISPLARASLANRWGVNPLVEGGWADVSTHTQIVDLTVEENALWQGLGSTARNVIRRCRDRGYAVRAVSWKEHLDAYDAIHTETYTRTGANPHPKAYFSAMGEALEKDGCSVLWAGFGPDGEPVAYHHDARFGPGAMYHVGCSRSDHMESGVNYLLFWEALRGEQAAGYTWYESGEVFPEVTGGKAMGLSDFKRKFGGELHRNFRGEVVFSSLPSSPSAPRGTRAWWSTMKTWSVSTFRWLRGRRP